MSNNTIQVVRWVNGEGRRVSALYLGRGRKHLRLIPMDGCGIRFARRVALSEERYLTPLERNGKPYPPKRAARHLLRAAKKFGGTKSALAALRNV